MGEQVEWNGRFVIIDNYLILQGKVRSLFFNFENRKVVSNIMEFPEAEEIVISIEQFPKLQNMINIILYAFGKWGTIRGIRVEQDYQQLNQIFTGILREYLVDSGFTRENFRFYKEGIRITYEDVIQLAIESTDKPIESENVSEEEERGLWHKLVWKRQKNTFQKVETTLAERQKERIGNNFYQVGYLCPVCKEKLQMVVYPVGKEQKIETNEGGVYLARAYTCQHCHCFYTPVPERLIQEGHIYQMDFGSDRIAYEDYLELLGENGERTSNYNYNEYAVMRNRRNKKKEWEEREENENEIFENADEAWRQMEAMCKRLREMPEMELNRFLARIEEGFYPDILLEHHEKEIVNQVKERKKSQTEKTEEPEQEQESVASKKVTDRKEETEKRKKEDVKREEKERKTEKEKKFGTISKETEEEERNQEAFAQRQETFEQGVKADEGQENQRKRIEERLKIWERLSPRQRQELQRQIQGEKQITEETKQFFLHEIKQKEEKETVLRLKDKTENCNGKPYAVVKRVLEEVEGADISVEDKTPLSDKLRQMLQKSGTEEVVQLMEKIPQNPDRRQFKEFMKKLKGYEGVDLTPYEMELSVRREKVEGQEAANMVKRARKNTRSDLTDLMKRLEEADFEPETLQPYMEELSARLREADQKAIDDICDNVMSMGFDELAEAYEKIDEGNFLPQLKVDALDMLAKRLAKIKTDECEALIQKLKDDMKGKIRDNERHHFYPARKVLMKNVTEEETAVIDYALGTYASNRGLFEYPILVVDTSRNGSGKEGMILTPEHIFTSTLLNAYYTPIQDVRGIKASTGLLNRGITLTLKNGSKMKLPFAVENDEIKIWSDILLAFISYLQEKPKSRNLNYLAKEKHETICCFRCGYVYKSGTVCPECGYKRNQ